jgi:hypothetical protein
MDQAIKIVIEHYGGHFGWLTVILVFIADSIIRGVLGASVANLVKALVKKIFLNTERRMAIFLHYRNLAYDKNHRLKHKRKCNDGFCLPLE